MKLLFRVESKSNREDAHAPIVSIFMVLYAGGSFNPRGQRVRRHRQTGPAGRAFGAVARACRRRGPRLPMPYECRAKRAPPDALWGPEGKLFILRRNYIFH